MKKVINIDGLQAPKKTKHTSLTAFPKPQLAAFDGLQRKALPKGVLPQAKAPIVSVRHQRPRNVPRLHVVSIFAANRGTILSALGIIVAFSLGIAYAASTPRSVADDPQQPVAVVTAAASMPIPLANAPAGVTASQDDLFNTPLELLQSYLSSAAPNVVAVRQAKLEEFLKQRNSPLESEAGLIAEQPHWKLILAISFAESTLGEHCYENNCSGIGGSNIRAYKSLDNWILDFNRLLENHYKDNTLEQMCGVYVQPCTSSWLTATRQILSALDEANIQ